jgi:hypothetical protein
MSWGVRKYSGRLGYFGYIINYIPYNVGIERLSSICNRVSRRPDESTGNPATNNYKVPGIETHKNIALSEISQ